ncbi:MAG: hypothetical protein ACYDGN_14680 [Acidimicrobiales bacterium]
MSVLWRAVYKTHTAAEYRRFLGLDEQYVVAGPLGYGVWDPRGRADLRIDM